MSLAEAVAANTTNARRQCAIPQLAATLAKADADEFLALLADRGTQLSALSKAIKQVHEVHIPATALSKHRNHGCACPR